MADAKTPNFFVAGAPKAGTTSLYYALRQHPEIYLSPMKEPCYFSRELWAENFVPGLRLRTQARTDEVHRRITAGPVGDDLAGIVTREEDYLRLFEDVRGEKAVGEASVCYLWSKTASALIAERSPAAKFILVLRNPADRAFSQYRNYVSSMAVPHSFSEHMRDSLEGKELWTVSNPLLQFGFYAEQLERYLALFPRPQIGIWLYEETLEDPAMFLREVFEFLDVDPDFRPDTSTRHKEVRTPRASGMLSALKGLARGLGVQERVPASVRPVLRRLFYKPQTAMRMRLEDRRFLIGYYRQDIERLSVLIQRDLSGWLRPV